MASLPAPRPNDLLFGSRPVRRRLVSIEAAAVAGIVCAVAWSISFRGLLSTPNVDASDADIVEFYSNPGVGRNAAIFLQVLVVGTIAFLWFIGVVRGRLGDNEPKLFGSVFLGASILLAGSLFAGTALLAAPSMLVEIGHKVPDPAASSLTRAAAATVLSMFAPRIATLVMFSTAALGRATGALPRWLIWVTYAVGIAEFVTVSLRAPTIYIVPLWIAVVSVVLLVRRPPELHVAHATPAPDEAMGGDANEAST